MPVEPIINVCVLVKSNNNKESAMSLTSSLGRINDVLIMNDNSIPPNPPGPHHHSPASEMSHFSTVKTSS